MEFENNQPTDDEQRLLVEAKKVTLQPLHAGITPDPIPDAEIAARNTQETSPNVSIDTEDTNTPQLVQPSKSALTKVHDTKLVARQKATLASATLPITIFIALVATGWLWLNAS